MHIRHTFSFRYRVHYFKCKNSYRKHNISLAKLGKLLVHSNTDDKHDASIMPYIESGFANLYIKSEQH